MTKGQDKGSQGGEAQAKSKSLSLSSDSLGISSTSAHPSTSRRSPYNPVSNIPLQGKKSETREIDKADTPKKRNRRRERKHKTKATEHAISTPSSSSTPYSSPSSNKARPSTPGNILSPLQTFKSLGIASSTKEKSKSKENLILTSSGSNQLVSPKFIYEISPVKNPKGKAFKKRNKKHKYINLKTFLGLAKTCIFKTELGQLSAAFKNLTLGPKNKKKNHKYFDVDKKVSVHEDYRSKQTTVSQTRRHSEMVISRTERDKVGNEVTQSVLVVEDSSVEVKERTSNSETPKKGKRPKKEKHKQHKLEKKLAREALNVFPPCLTAEEAKLDIQVDRQQSENKRKTSRKISEIIANSPKNYRKHNKGEENGELIRGFLRVNPKNSRDSYVSNLDSTLSDYHVTSVADRNGALDGDEVLLKLKSQTEWPEGKPTAVVVFIVDKIHPRTTVGTLKRLPNETEYAMFYPRDKRMPVMRIPTVSWPNGFSKKPKEFANILFVARLVEWPQPDRAMGVITNQLGMAGDLRVETMAILKEFCLDITPFAPDMVQHLPKSKNIPAEELEYREDIRKECVFTIDPLTAKDLDDAVSVKELPNGHYEIGVHISDATYYLPEGTSLDDMVRTKATTIYLVDTVYHMLPVELCLHCSLLPGEDKLSFSVFWEMDEQGQVYNTRFARTVLNSCSKLAYEHAQQMIEDPNKEFKQDELPQIFNGFTAKDLSNTVNVLQKIAVNLREARVRNGSLRIDQIKLLFSLNPSTGEPLDFIAYENKESHRLIEEFMLLANISVAKKINESFPDLAFLRCHEPPKYTMLAEAQRCLETCGILVDISSSSGIHSSLRKYITDDYQGLCRGIVLNHVFAKPMTRARYFCAGTMESEEGYSHYALSVPIYTHFTSPIRRYADIMVHRLLAASLGYVDKPKWDLDNVITVAANCNKQKYNSKRAGEASSDLYLAHYIEKNQPYVQDCVVVDVKDRSFDAIVLKTGSMVRVYQRECEDNPTWTVETIPSSNIDPSKKPEHEKKVLRLVISFPPTSKQPQPHRMVVEMFTVVKVSLKRVPNTYKLTPFLLRPFLSRTFERSSSGEAAQSSSRSHHNDSRGSKKRHESKN